MRSRGDKVEIYLCEDCGSRWPGKVYTKASYTQHQGTCHECGQVETITRLAYIDPRADTLRIRNEST